MTYNKETLKEAIVQKLRLNYGCTEQQATDGEMMKACAMVLRDIMAEHGVQTREELSLIHILVLSDSDTVINAPLEDVLRRRGRRCRRR